MSEDDRDQDYVRLHKDSEYAKEGSEGISVKCPHCGEWNATHEVQHSGCDCGAEASTWMKFEK